MVRLTSLRQGVAPPPGDSAHQRCIRPACGTTYELRSVHQRCAKCGALLDVVYDWERLPVPDRLALFDERRATSRHPLDYSGVWRFRELLPFADLDKVLTIGEGQTQLRRTDSVAAYVGLDLGATVRIGAGTWTIVGVFDGKGTAFDSEVWADAAILNGFYQRPPNVFQTATVRLRSADDFPAFEATLKGDPRLNVQALREPAYYAKQSQLITTLITSHAQFLLRRWSSGTIPLEEVYQQLDDAIDFLFREATGATASR